VTSPVWKTAAPEFPSQLSALLKRLSLEEGLRAAESRTGEAPEAVVRRIIEDVRRRGDAALVEYARRFDGCRLTPETLRVSDQEVEAALERCPADLLTAIELAAERIRRFQEATLARQPKPVSDRGRLLRVRCRPVDSAGLCVPGAAASLASTVLMCAVPAKVAGVRRIAMVTPPAADGSVSDDRLAAARVAGVDEVYRISGAQAVAALAYGTQSVPPVDFIAGPGNVYVALAKKLVFGQVGIEALPGPSEVVVIADRTADPSNLAADLISQAEHDPGCSILLSDEEELLEQVRRAIEEQLAGLPRAEAARDCLAAYGALIACRSLAECVELANRIAPEHLEVQTAEPERVAEEIRHAGAIFLGPWSPVAVGDYLAGPSHVLPTGRTARFSSGLSANDFLKRSSLIRYDRQALAEDASALARLARAEGLEGHARSVEARLGRRAGDA
jgi:histidinol dehydrogenase